MVSALAQLKPEAAILLGRAIELAEDTDDDMVENGNGLIYVKIRRERIAGRECDALAAEISRPSAAVRAGSSSSRPRAPPSRSGWRS